MGGSIEDLDYWSKFWENLAELSQNWDYWDYVSQKSTEPTTIETERKPRNLKPPKGVMTDWRLHYGN